MKQHEINVQNLGMLQYRQYEQSNMVWLLHVIHIRLNSHMLNMPYGITGLERVNSQRFKNAAFFSASVEEAKQAIIICGLASS